MLTRVDTNGQYSGWWLGTHDVAMGDEPAMTAFITLRLRCTLWISGCSICPSLLVDFLTDARVLSNPRAMEARGEAAELTERIPSACTRKRQAV